MKRGAKNVVYPFNEVLFSHKKQGDIAIVTTWTELEGFMLSKITEIGKYPMISLICRT